MAMAIPNTLSNKLEGNIMTLLNHTESMVNSPAMDTVLELAHAQGVEILNDKNGKLIAAKVHTELLDFVLKDIDRKYITIAVKLLIASEAHKDLPLATIMAQFAIAVKMESTLAFRLGGVVFNLVKRAGLMQEYMKDTINGRRERVVKLPSKWAITDEIFKELMMKVGQGARPFKAKDWTPIIKGGYSNTKWVSGSRLNEVIPQTQEMYDLLNYKQSIAYQVDWDVFNTFRDNFQDSFPAMESMIEIHKLQAELEILGTEPAYFAWNFGTNGRMYCQGYRTHRQAGIRNELFDFHKRTTWSEQDYHIVERQIADLKGDTSAKGMIQLYKLERDLGLQRNGEPTGTIIKRDAKMSGVQQVGAIMMRSKVDADSTGLLETFTQDGRLTLAAQPKMAKYNLDKPQAKAAAMTWMYLSGGDAMVNKVKDDTGRDLGVDGKTFKLEWDEAGKDVFPGQIRFMYECMGIIKYKKCNTHFRWTSSSGFKVSIAATGTVDEVINTVMGKHSFSRQEIDAEFMGVRLGAGAGHAEDAASDHIQTRHAMTRGVDIDTVFDQFGYHLGDSQWGDEVYSEVMRWKLGQPILANFFQDVASNGRRADHVMLNTLHHEDVKAGLFD